MPRIERMFAFVVEEAPGDEGLVGAQLGDWMMPLVGADMARINDLRPIAQMVADKTKRQVRLLEFGEARLVEVLSHADGE